MTLIKSISGIRGTIGGAAGDGLTPLDIVKFTSAYGAWAVAKSGINKIVIGRDARISGEMVNNLVTGTLQGLGIDVIDLGLSTTPTVEVAVPAEKAAGGIILTASHNPKQWNALKLLNADGEFISDAEGNEILGIIAANDLKGAIDFLGSPTEALLGADLAPILRPAEDEVFKDSLKQLYEKSVYLHDIKSKKSLQLQKEAIFKYADVNDLGSVSRDNDYLQYHIDKILALPLVDAEAVANANFKIAIDCVNSTGGIFVPALLKALGVKTVHQLFCEPDGIFPHNPEPLPENLTALSKEVLAKRADLGIAVDPDVDRLCFVCEDGNMFGEEYTLVAIADYILKHEKGATVSNLSSTRALRDVTEKAGCQYYGAAVGEVNVVNKMKEVKAVIGGEGNGGVIYPELHYGRDALVGIALFLTHLAKFGKPVSLLRSTYPGYYISKNKITLTPEMDIDGLLKEVEEKYKNHPYTTIDGLKIEFDKEWVHLRKSNTEPIIRIYSEGNSETIANNLAKKIIADIKDILK